MNFKIGTYIQQNLGVTSPVSAFSPSLPHTLSLIDLLPKEPTVGE